MRVLFSADWHIRLGAKNIPIEWAKNRYGILFQQLHGLEEQVDLHVIGGDIFDKVPSMQELELYFDYISGCNCETIIFAGNHESTTKHGTFFTQLKEVTNRINTLVTVIDDYYSLENMDFIPYNKLKEFEKTQPEFNGNILFTHCRGDIPPHVKAEIDLELFDKWQVVLAGDLHSHSNSQRNIIYPGSPCTTSFHRDCVDTGVIILNSEDCSYTWQKLQVPQLIRKTIQAGEEMPATEYHHTIYEITGDISELGAVESNELIDKKIVKRVSDCALILDPMMTIQDELNEYLQYILQLPEETIIDLMKEFNDNIKDIKLG